MNTGRNCDSGGEPRAPAPSAVALPSTPRPRSPASVLTRNIHLSVFTIRVFGGLLNSPRVGFWGSSPHVYKDGPWKPADADVLIWTSCVKEGGIDGNCLPAAANSEGAARGERGPRPGEGMGGGKGREGERTFAPDSMWTVFPGSGHETGVASFPLSRNLGHF